MKKYLGLSFFLIVFLTGCSNPTLDPREPVGTPVELSSADKEAAKRIFESKQQWYMWHMKGIRLSAQGRYQEAVYCFNKAIGVWPKNVTAEEEKKSIGTHRPEPTDTFLQKGSLYLKMNEPELALLYLKKYQKYFPYDSNSTKMMDQAKKMLVK